MNRRSRKRDRDRGGYLEQITPEESSIIGTTARDEYDEIDIALLKELSQTGDPRSLFVDGPSEGLGLFRDLLKHQGQTLTAVGVRRPGAALAGSPKKTTRNIGQSGAGPPHSKGCSVLLALNCESNCFGVRRPGAALAYVSRRLLR